MSGVDELLAFVRRCLDERERVAEAVDEGRRRWQVGGCVAVETVPVDATDEWVTIVYDEGAPTPQEAEHIALNDPESVLADIRAKRAILDRYEDALARQSDHDYSLIDADVQVEEYETWIIPALAHPYAGREGWREEWAL